MNDFFSARQVLREPAIILVIEGVLADALYTALSSWRHDSASLYRVPPADAQSIPKQLNNFGGKALIVAGLFTKDQEEMAGNLLVSVRLLRGEWASIPFVFLALDRELPSIFQSPGCHIRLLPRDAASLEHIHALQVITDWEREQFITEFGKPALWDKILKDGHALFHNPGKKTVALHYASDNKMLSMHGLAFCFYIRTSLKRLDRYANLIGLSLAVMWPETKNLSIMVTQMEDFLTTIEGRDFALTKKEIRSQREQIIAICTVLENRLKDEGGIPWEIR